MSDINLTPVLRSKMGMNRPRIRGRYNASELWAIANGYLTPEQYFSPKPRTVNDFMKMWSGIIVHEQVQKLLGQDKEKKVEYKRDGVTLVAKADYLPGDIQDEVWEIKTSETEIDKAKPWFKYQTRLYCTMFNKKRGVIYQPVFSRDGLFLRDIGTVERDDDWFEKQIQVLLKFNEEVEKIWERRRE